VKWALSWGGVSLGGVFLVSRNPKGPAIHTALIISNAPKIFFKMGTFLGGVSIMKLVIRPFVD